MELLQLLTQIAENTLVTSKQIESLVELSRSQLEVIETLEARIVALEASQKTRLLPVVQANA